MRQGEGREDAEEGEERPPDNRKGLREPAKLGEQDGEHKDHGEDEDEEEITKRLLLLLVETAVLDTRARRQDDLIAHLSADLRDRAAEVAVREAGLDGDRLPKILAADLRLTGLILEGAETIEREQRSRGRLEEELAQAPDAVGVVGFRANPDVDRAVPPENERGHVAENRGVGEARDLAHVQAGACGGDRIDPQGEG